MRLVLSLENGVCFLLLREWTSLPQPAYGKPVSPFRVLGVRFTNECFPYELLHSCGPHFVLHYYNSFCTCIFEEEVWKQWVRTTTTLFRLNICFSTFQEEVWCDEPTQPLHSSSWTSASQWGNTHSSNIQCFVWGKVWASGKSWSWDQVLRWGTGKPFCILVLDLTSGSGFATGLSRHVMHMEVKLQHEMQWMVSKATACVVKIWINKGVR